MFWHLFCDQNIICSFISYKSTQGVPTTSYGCLFGYYKNSRGFTRRKIAKKKQDQTWPNPMAFELKWTSGIWTDFFITFKAKIPFKKHDMKREKKKEKKLLQNPQRLLLLPKGQREGKTVNWQSTRFEPFYEPENKITTFKKASLWEWNDLNVTKDIAISQFFIWVLIFKMGPFVHFCGIFLFKLLRTILYNSIQFSVCMSAPWI